MVTITAEYTATLKNYYEADHFFRKRYLSSKFNKICEIAIIVMGLFSMALGSYLLGIIFLFFGVLFFFKWERRLVTRINFNRAVKKIGRETLIFSEEKILYRTQLIDTEIDWGAYSDYLETPNTILLIYQSFKHYVAIPKSCLSKTEGEALLLMLNNKLSKLSDDR